MAVRRLPVQRQSTRDVLDIDVSGVNVLANHFHAVAGILADALPAVLDVTADIGIERARELTKPNIRTGATYNSINKDPGVMNFGHTGNWYIDYGPTTFYSGFLEYGVERHGGGFNQPYPFVIPSGDMAEVALYASIIGLVSLLDSNNAGAGIGFAGGVAGRRALNSPGVKSPMGRYRSFLYTTAKALGDVSVFGGRGFLGPLRGQMYSLARMMGDIQAGMSGAVAGRVIRRLHGRVTGRLIGFGSASLSHSATYSAFVGGSSGHRIYQRVAGRLGSGGFNPQSIMSRILPP